MERQKNTYAVCVSGLKGNPWKIIGKMANYQTIGFDADEQKHTVSGRGSQPAASFSSVGGNVGPDLFEDDLFDLFCESLGDFLIAHGIA